MSDNRAAPGPQGGTPDPKRTQNDPHSGNSQGGQHSSGSGGGRLLLIGIVIIGVLILLLAIGIIPRMKQTHKIDDQAHAAASEAVEVNVTKPKTAPDSILTLPGSTQAIKDAQVGARTTGYVTRRYVDIGMHVRAGQVLADIDSPDVDQQLYQANAQVAQSVATVQQSQSDVANRQATVAQTRSSLRQTEANLEQSKAQLADYRAKLAQLVSAESTAEAQFAQAQQNVGIKQAALKQANTQLNLAKVTYQRYETLLKSGYVALQDVDQNKANYENAQAAVNSAESDLNATVKAVDAAKSNVGSAQANVASGEAEVRSAQKNVSAVAATVGAARAAVNAAAANVKSGESIVTANRYNQIANQANSKRLAVLTSFEKVVAPFDGVITARNVDVGSLINSGSGASSSSGSSGSTSATSTANVGSASTSSSTPTTTPSQGLFGIARTDVLRILVAVPQTFSTLIHPGLVTRILLNEFPGQSFTGIVAYVSGALDTTSRTLLTEIHIPNGTGRILPGMYAQVVFDLPKSNSGLRVPATAVIYDAQGTRVVTVSPDKKLHYAPVRLGRDFDAELEILDGITPNDTIVTDPSDDLTEGQAVKPVFPPPAQPSQGAAPAGVPGPSQPAPQAATKGKHRVKQPAKDAGGNSTQLQ